MGDSSSINSFFIALRSLSLSVSTTKKNEYLKMKEELFIKGEFRPKEPLNYKIT